MIKIAPSIAAAPLLNLERTIHLLEQGGADMVHFDLEDGCFVPVMTLGTKIIRDLRPLTTLPFDVHLMMMDPEWILPELRNAGVDRVSVHYEACQYPRRVLGQIVNLGMQAGLAFNPKTAIPELQYCLPYLSFIVVLSTEPETRTCDFLPVTLSKIEQGKRHPNLDRIQWVVDGGVSEENILEVVKAGANVVVCGRAVFMNTQVEKNLENLKRGSLVA